MNFLLPMIACQILTQTTTIYCYFYKYRGFKQSHYPLRRLQQVSSTQFAYVYRCTSKSSSFPQQYAIHVLKPTSGNSVVSWWTFKIHTLISFSTFTSCSEIPNSLQALCATKFWTLDNLVWSLPQRQSKMVDVRSMMPWSASFLLSEALFAGYYPCTK